MECTDTCWSLPRHWRQLKLSFGIRGEDRTAERPSQRLLLASASSDSASSSTPLRLPPFLTIPGRVRVSSCVVCLCIEQLTILLNSLIKDNFGAVNGFAGSVGSGMRALAPILCGSLFSAATAIPDAPAAQGLPFYLLCSLLLGGFCLTARLPSQRPPKAMLKEVDATVPAPSQAIVPAVSKCSESPPAGGSGRL